MSAIPMRIYMLLGGLIGPDGWVDSRGMLTLSDRLAKLPGVTVERWAWSDAQAATSSIRRQPDTTLIGLIGYSGGGPAAVVIANAISPRPVKLMVLYDPSPASQMAIRRVGSNVERAICYFNTSTWWMWLSGGFGGGYIRGSAKRIENIHVSEEHLVFQFDKALHTQTEAAVRHATGLS